MSTHVLVTGGAGYIGSACVAALVQEGYAVTVVDDCSTGQPAVLPSAATLYKTDITDRAAHREVFAMSAPVDAVIHCAAKKAVGESETDPTLYFHTNVVGSLNLLRCLEEFQVPQLIFSSTAAVYDAPEEGACVHEDTPTAPQNVYGTTKLMVEEAIRAYARTGVLTQYTILRYFNVAGDAGLKFLDPQPQNIFPLLAAASRGERELTIFGTDYDTSDGTCVRDYIHLLDLVAAHLAALKSSESGTYNLGTGQGYSVRELVDMFATVVGHDLPVQTGERRAGDPARLLASAHRAERDLGWTPRHTLREMVESTLAAYE